MVNPGRQLSPTQLLTHCLAWWDEGENQKGVKVRKLVGWHKISLISKAKLHTQAKQNKKLLLSFGRKMFRAISRKAGFHQAQWLLGKTNAITPDAPPSFTFPQLYMLSTTSYGIGHPFGQLMSAVPAAPPHSLLPTPSLLMGRAT